MVYQITLQMMEGGTVKPLKYHYMVTMTSLGNPLSDGRYDS